MHISYNIDKLKQILDDFSIITGVSIGFLNKDYELIYTAKKENDFCETLQSSDFFANKCLKCDKEILDRSKNTLKFTNHLCHAGLYDAALPVIINSVSAGFLIMGRVRSDDSPFECPFSYEEGLSSLYKEVPYFSEKQIHSLKTFLPNILFSDAITLESDESSEEISEYIKENLSSPLSVDSICKEFFISRNHLYKIIKAAHGVTVNEYITSLRLNKAKRLLKETNENIYSLCEKVGIYNYTYFCRLFKKKEGIAPYEYRKLSRMQQLK